MHVLVAERLLAEAFEVEFPHERGRVALEINDDETGTIPPSTKSLAISWIRLNPEEVNDARDQLNEKLSEEFQKQFGEKTPGLAVRIFNGFAEQDELHWESHAGHWRAFNADVYEAELKRLIDAQSDAFIEEYPNFTPMEAASVIENEALSKLIADEDMKEELAVTPDQYMRAKCWGLRHQGLLKAAKAKIDLKNDKQLETLWPELEQVTDTWRKGAYTSLTPAQIKDHKLDRFYGFRERLLNKYAWVYGHLNRMYLELFAETETFDSADPMGKVIYGIRPSEFEKYKRNIEDAFLKHKIHVQTTLTDVVGKLGTWNTYFGLSWGDEEEGQYEGEWPTEATGEEGTGDAEGEGVTETKA